KVPLLIGGATTSFEHTAVKIAPCYSEPVLHVKDASRCVPVVDRLMRPEQKKALERDNRTAQEKERASRAGPKKKLVSYAEALARRFPIDWQHTPIARPSFLGVRTLPDFPLPDLVPYIDWTPFFQAWELKGQFPQILEDATAGKEARDLFEKGNQLLKDILARKLFKAQGVYGFFPAGSDGDDIVVFSDEARNRELKRFCMLRQQWERTGQTHFLSLADFIAPVESGAKDYLGAFALSAGFGAHELVHRFKKDHDDYNAIMAEALADRLADAFAEYLHERARKDWGYGLDEHLSKPDLVAEKYRGTRPAAGYPSCPDHTEKRTLWDLLDVEKHSGITLTDSYAMWPAERVSGLYFAHPQAHYFGIHFVTRDQVENYARRKGMTLAEAERWLAPVLGYQ